MESEVDELFRWIAKHWRPESGGLLLPDNLVCVVIEGEYVLRKQAAELAARRGIK